MSWFTNLFRKPPVRKALTPFDPFSNGYFIARLADARHLATAPSRGVLLGYEIVSDLSQKPRVAVVRHPQKKGELLVVKVIADQFVSPQRRADLLDEANSMLDASDDGVQQLEEVRRDFATNTVGIVTPWCAGGSLRERIKSGSMEAAEAYYHLLVLARTLTRLHAAGLVHCDLKPENVLLNYDANRSRWETLLADLGMTTKARSRRRGYTPAYAAPEVLEGAEPAPPEDIWTWGVLAWELLANRHPYVEALEASKAPGEVAAAVRQAISTAVPPTDEGAEWLVDLIRSAVEPEPSRRPSAKDLLEAFALHCAFVKGDQRIGDENATILFPLSSLIDVLEHGWPKSPGVMSTTTSLGWMGRLGRAESRLKLDTLRGDLDAFREIHTILGDEEDVRSPLHQLRAKLEKITMEAAPENRTDFQLIHPIAHRSRVLPCLETGILAFVRLVESHQVATPAVLRTARQWARVCATLIDELNPPQMVLASELFLFFGDWGIATILAKRALAVSSSHQVGALATLHEVAWATGQQTEAIELSRRIQRECADRGFTPQGINWAMNECLELLDANAPLDDVIAPAKRIPANTDIAGMIWTVVRRRAGIDPDREDWAVLRHRALSAERPPKARLAIQCIWFEEGEDAAVEKAAWLLEQPIVSLPFYERYRADLASVVQGTPWFL